MDQNFTVLIVEDEILIANYLAMEIQSRGDFSVHKVNRSDAAIEFAEKSIPDVILMDIHLAGHNDGITAAGKILSKRKIPIIFLSGFSSSDMKEQLEQIRPLAFLDKPICIDDLMDILLQLKNK